MSVSKLHFFVNLATEQFQSGYLFVNYMFHWK